VIFSQQHRLFDPLYFLSQKGIPDAAFDDPYKFYCENWRENPQWDPHPLFSNQHYLSQLDSPPAGSPLEDYLSEDEVSEKPDPNAHFDQSFYSEEKMAKPAAEYALSALEHYIQACNTSCDTQPNRFFDTEYFDRHNKDLKVCKLNALESLLRDPESCLRLTNNKFACAMVSAFGLTDGPHRKSWRPVRVLYIPSPEDQVDEASLLKNLENANQKGEVQYIAILPPDSPHLADPGYADHCIAANTWFEDVPSSWSRASLSTLILSVVSPFKPTLLLSSLELSAIQLHGAIPVMPERAAIAIEENQPSRLDISGPPKVIIPISDWQISGVNTWVNNIANGLTEMGREVELLCTRDFYRFTTTDALPDVPIRLLRAPLSKPDLWWEAVRDYVNSLSNVVVLTAYDFDFNSLATICEPHIPMIGVIHSDDPVYYGQCERFGGYWHHIICVSEFIAQHLKKKFPLWKEKISPVHYGVTSWEGALPTPPKPDEPIRIIYTGRIVHHQKRLFDLPLLLEELDALNTPYKITLAGDGSDRVELEEMLSTYIDCAKVRFAGRLSSSQIQEELSTSHIFLLISDFEGLPLSLLEAMSHGVVPVVSDIASGIPEVIHQGETGYRIPIGDYKGFAAVISDLHYDSKKWQTVSTNTRQFFTKELTRDVMTRRTSQIIDEVADPARRAEFNPKPLS